MGLDDRAYLSSGDGRGAQSISFLLQFDLDRTRRRIFDPGGGIEQSRGLQELFRNIFR